VLRQQPRNTLNLRCTMHRAYGWQPDTEPALNGKDVC
jgi:hypothetical protein